MRPAVRIVSGDGHGLALAGASEEGALEVVVASRRHPRVRASRLPVDSLHALLVATSELRDAVCGVLACDGADVGREELEGAVLTRAARVARVAGVVS